MLWRALSPSSLYAIFLHTHTPFLLFLFAALLHVKTDTVIAWLSQIRLGAFMHRNWIRWILIPIGGDWERLNMQFDIVSDMLRKSSQFWQETPENMRKDGIGKGKSYIIHPNLQYQSVLDAVICLISLSLLGQKSRFHGGFGEWLCFCLSQSQRAGKSFYGNQHVSCQSFLRFISDSKISLKLLKTAQ